VLDLRISGDTSPDQLIARQSFRFYAAFCAEAAFHTSGPLLAKFSGHDLPVIFMFSCPAVTFEVCCDFVLGAPLPVGINGIDVIS